nr:EAL domain-containing protein [Croceicoccus marinus]
MGRWESAKLGKIVPGEFIEAAERLNTMGTITLSLFDKLLQDVKLLPQHQTISFNLSAHDIVTSATVDALVAAIDNSGLAPGRFVFEITETALMRDFATATRNIHRLRQHGISIALDDFGTGFSSLGYLNRLPIDKIKIDRSFVQDLDEAGGTRILQAILEMCRALDLECIIEGIETERQGSILADLGCQFAQGFHYASPMTIKQVPAWMLRRDMAATRPPIAMRSIGAL